MEWRYRRTLGCGCTSLHICATTGLPLHGMAPTAGALTAKVVAAHQQPLRLGEHVRLVRQAAAADKHGEAVQLKQRTRQQCTLPPSAMALLAFAWLGQPQEQRWA